MESLQRFFPGDTCYAIFAEDGLWYEARVLKSDGKRAATVEFVDYGNVQECTAEQLKSKLREKTETIDDAARAKQLAEKPLGDLDFNFGLDGVMDAVEAIDLTNVAAAAEPKANDIEIEFPDK